MLILLQFRINSSNFGENNHFFHMSQTRNTVENELLQKKTEVELT